MKTPMTPWQLRLFKKTLKKQQRLRQLQNVLGRPEADERCLLITCGDNNGAMNWYLRELGGQWSWADLEEKSIAEMSDLLGDPVYRATSDRLPFEEKTFRHVVCIDVLEHIRDAEGFTRELTRITADGGQVIITVPGGDRRKLANRLKAFVGMTKEEYGHVRDGFSVAELSDLMAGASIEPRRQITFSRFFTELVELAINFAYVKKMASKSSVKVEKGTIAPATAQQLKSVEKAYRLYSILFPFVWSISKLDYALFFTSGYVSLVEGRRHPDRA
ncbi:MAG: methyltransferase domain-containing protein [Acidobacteriota bacterium]